ncbi:unnamed protein product [Cylindrotheca closterium]|uniref:G-protein coupled receptors family 2 profile 2 domain-containing protein n=1 Tax=Cylindrotheca closterium TaxID=2856 RepID=A0AAD2FFU2_9STRA|nr:unnamed protein product [Cylindrotheca closterium]
MDDFIFPDNDPFERDTIPDDNTIQDDDQYAYRSLTDSQKNLLAILPIPSAILSVFGSSVIIFMAYLSRKSKPWTPYNRLLVAMSVYDIITSIALGCATFLGNRETSNKAWAMGTDSTCSAMGFLNNIAFSGTLYNASLSYYFLFTARFRMKNDQIARRIEPAMHIFSVGFPLITGIIGLVLGVYAEPVAGMGCWVYRYPKGCGSGPNATGEPCISTMISYIFGSWIGFFTLASLFVNNLIIWAFVRQQIGANGRNSVPPSNSSTGEFDDSKSGTFSSFRTGGTSFRIDASQNSVTNEDIRDSQERRLRLVRSQAILFVASYVASSMITYILRLFESQAFDYVQEMELPYSNYTLMILQSILLPLQGLFNMMVYIRPKYIRNRNDFPRESRVWSIRRAVLGAKVEPVHSLVIDIQGGNKNAAFSSPAVVKGMVSSLTNASGGDAKDSDDHGMTSGDGLNESSELSKSIVISRASGLNKNNKSTNSNSMQVINEISEAEDSSCFSVSSRQTAPDQYGQSARSSGSHHNHGGGGGGSFSVGILMDGSLVESPKPA